MAATFLSLRDLRLPKALHAVTLLNNLVRYDHTEVAAKTLVNAVFDAADDLDAVFAKKWGWTDTSSPAPLAKETLLASYKKTNEEFAAAHAAEKARVVPPGTAEGGASFEDEVRWALDAVKRGDCKLAEARLKLILKGGDA